MKEQSDSYTYDSSKNLYLRKKAFLESWQLESHEAQIILEVCSSREYYIDVLKLSRRIQKASERVQFDLERVLKDLIQRGYIRPYESKKEKFCVRSDKRGRDFIKMSVSHGFESFEDMPILGEKYSQIELMCYDPQQFKKGEIRYASGPNGKIPIKIVDIVPSDEIYSTTNDGKTIYGIRLIASAKCPRCGNQIPIDFSYVTENCYIKSNPFRCDKCRFQFMLLCAMYKYST